MGRIISVTNQKGGVGKTTTTVSLAATLAEAGKKVLLVDVDPQGNASSGVGVEKSELENTMYELMHGEVSFEDCVIETEFENLSILPANVELSGIEIDILDMENREYLIKNIFAEVRDNYDYILIDCPPSLNMLTVNALSASDSVLVPIQCEYYALEGLSQLLHTIDLVKKRLNPNLEIEGIVFTMYDARTNLSMQVVENVRENLDHHIFETIIPRNIRLAEAPSHGEPITTYAPSSAGAESYRQLAQELINKKE